MSVCRNLKGFTREHEHLADFFSLMSVALLFGTLYVGVSYHTPIMAWMGENMLLRIPLFILTILLDLFLMFLFLNLGSARSADDDESCFHTFKGRRGDAGSIGKMFSGWLHHMEQVGRRHR
ncbi:hypothetical protein [endosymbiont of Ridgeia piscesae]|jgi:uncharacterized membrane protein|uniref:Cell division protein BolA n=1 Tax=endosymbiont of Ridgeia piscesae TaxID=54398 RepID=A0A0T5YW25_9GAMM|nr:hypothetical protein [endosymbiont of Ridgeia piscesae]KRT54802.1 hypothetical protein Ga0074115_11014 [endosymbiont of Ridgeia piscesae]KRT57717.1 hypothetical protein Ga0076813_12112 [endosymbiont of Ridgeia piscesae]